MANQSSKSGFRIRPLYIVLFFLLVFFVLGGVYLSQQTKLAAIGEDKTKLQTQLDSLKVEEERLDRMLGYMQTEEYLEQYAREKLGYVYPSDYKFYDESAVKTNSPLSTPTPTTEPSPEPSSSPAVTAPPVGTTPPEDGVTPITIQ